MKKILVVLLSILCIAQSFVIPQKIHAETYSMSVNEYTQKLKKLESYAKKYGGDKDQNILNYIKGVDPVFQEYCDKKDTALNVLQNVSVIKTSAGNVNASQLISGCITKSARNDYKRYAGYVESEEFYTAMDELFISNTHLANSISSYYTGLTSEDRIKKFADRFYGISDSSYDSMKQQIKKVNSRYGIRTSDSLVNFFYEHYPAQKLQSFDVDGENYVEVGGTTTLDVKLIPSNAKYKSITYTSKNPEIATVSSQGVIYGRKKGKFTIEVRVDNQIVDVTMNCLVPVTSIQDLTKETDVLVGKTVQMKTEITPKNATIQTLKYQTSDPNIATVDKNGKVKAVGPGYVYITAKAYNGQSIVHKFRIYQKIQRIKAEDKKTLIMGKPERISYQIFPLDFTDNRVKFSSADPDIVTVDSTGMMYPKKNGTGQVLVESKDAADIYGVTNVTVITKMNGIVPDKWQSYYMGHPQKFRYDTDPVTTSNKKLKYYMKKNDYASVKSDGTIVPKKIGQTEMTVKSTDGTKLSKKVTIYIEQMVEKITVKKNIYLKKGESFHVYYTIAPVNATKKAIILKSEDDSKVGTKGDTVIAKGYGKTKVTIQSQDPGHKSTSFCVIVKRPFWHYLLAAVVGILIMVGVVELLKKERKKEK